MTVENPQSIGLRNQKSQTLGAFLLLGFLAGSQALLAQGALSVLVVDPKSASQGPQAKKAPAAIAMTSLFDFDRRGLALECDQDAPDLPEGVSCGPFQEGGLDHISAGVGLRNWDKGVLPLRGAPEGSQIIAAWVYYASMEEVGTEPFLTHIQFAETPLQATMVATGQETCWNPDKELRIYHIAVTHLIEDPINGDYLLKFLAPLSELGRDPWNESQSPTKPLIEGASLVVVYVDRDKSPESRVLLHLGPANFFKVSGLLVSHQLKNALPAAAEFKLTTIAADGQTHSPTLPMPQKEAYFRDSRNSTWKFRGGGSTVDGRPSLNGASGGDTTQLWDNETVHGTLHPQLRFDTSIEIGYRLVGSLQAAPAGAENAYPVALDCISIIAHGMTVSPLILD